MRTQQLQVTPKSQNLNSWYKDIALKADLVGDISVPGDYAIKPYGLQLLYAIENSIRSLLQTNDYEEIRLPTFIPMRMLGLVNDFPRDSLVVTVEGGRSLSNPLIARTASDILFGNYFANQIVTKHDLPKRLYQWGNIYNCEEQTIPFLSGREKIILEAYSAHFDELDSLNELEKIKELLTKFSTQVLAFPAIFGISSVVKKFHPAVASYSFLARSTPSTYVRFGAIHNMGEALSSAFGIKFSDQSRKKKFVTNMGWVVSSSVLAATLVIHGDDKGIILPPSIAPMQIVIIPIYSTYSERALCNAKSQVIRDILEENGFRVSVDDRDEYTPGYKFNDWEMRGVPLRIEIGTREISESYITYVRRDESRRVKGSMDSVVSDSAVFLEKMHVHMLSKSSAVSNTDKLSLNENDYDAFASNVKKEWVRAHFCGRLECERGIEKETNASVCYVLENDQDSDICVRCQSPAKLIGLFGIQLADELGKL